MHSSTLKSKVDGKIDFFPIVSLFKPPTQTKTDLNEL